MQLTSEYMRYTDRLFSPLSRILLSAIFIVSGFAKIFAWDQTLGYMTSLGMPYVRFFLVAAIITEIVGGLSVLFGLKARYGAALLALYLVPVTFVFHSFWGFAGAERQMQLISFLKNLALIGGLMGVVRHGAGALSLDSRFYHRRQPAHVGQPTQIRRVA